MKKHPTIGLEAVSHRPTVRPTTTEDPPMTELEALCQWLNASSKSESDRFFTVYYQIVGKYLPRHIKQFVPSSSGLAQDFYHNLVGLTIYPIKIERPKNVTRIHELTAGWQATHPSQLFERQIQGWGKEASVRANSALSFPLDHKDIRSPVLDDKAKELNGQMAAVKMNGKRLTEPFKDKNGTETETKLVKEAQEATKLLSKMGIPLKAWLYKTAYRKVLDYYKKKSELSFEYGLDDENEEGDSYGFGDFIGEIDISYERLEAQQNIDYLLKAPIRKAEDDLQKAEDALKKTMNPKKRLDCEGHILACVEKLNESVASYEELWKMLGLMQAGHTQEEIAVELGITRDMVRSRQAKIKMLLTPLYPVTPVQSVTPVNP